MKSINLKNKKILFIILFFNVFSLGFTQTIATWTGQYKLAFDSNDPQYIYLQVVPDNSGYAAIIDGTVAYINFPSNTFTTSNCNSLAGSYSLKPEFFSGVYDGSWQIKVLSFGLDGTSCGMVLECNLLAQGSSISVTAGTPVNLIKIKLPNNCTDQTYRLYENSSDPCVNFGDIYANGLVVEDEGSILGYNSDAYTGNLTTSESPLFCVNAALAWKTIGPSSGTGDWTDKSIWEYYDGTSWIPAPVAPNNDRPIYVFHSVTIPASTTINADSLFVEPTGIVSVPSTSTFNVTDQLVIKIDTDGKAGQLNSNGDCDNIVTTAAKIIVRKALDASWDFISFPFEVTASQVYISGTNTNSNTPAIWGNISPSTSNASFYAAQYDGASRATVSNGAPDASIGKYWKDVDGSKFVAVRGYIITGGNNGASSLDFVANESLDFCNNSYNPEISDATLPNCNGGWNLVGNPYVSAYDLRYASPHKAYYVAPDYTPVYDGQSVPAILKPFGAFFMQAISATPVTYPVTGLPQGAPRQTPKYNNLELAINNTARSNKTLVRLTEEGNVNYQLGEDALNLNINTSAPQIYTEAFGACSGLTVNTLPLNTERVDLKVRIASLDTYTIKLTNKDILNNIKTATLVDTETGLQTDLINSEDGYTFDATEIGTSSRFYVLLSPNISTNIDKTGNEDIDVIIKGKNISLSGLNGEAGVRMYDVVGKLIYQYKDLQNGQSFDVNVPGVYLIDISTQTQNERVKVLIQDK